MRLSSKVLVLVIIATLIPLGIVTFGSYMAASSLGDEVTQSIDEFGDRAKGVTKTVDEHLYKSGEHTVLIVARENALWLKEYLEARNITTLQQLLNDEKIKQLGSHKWFGKEYIWIAGIYGDRDWRLLVHPLGEKVAEKRIVEDLHWDEKYPEVVPILQDSAIGGQPTQSCGYYTWGEVYGKPVKKYLCNVPVYYEVVDEKTGKKVPLMVGTGAYLDSYFKEITASKTLPGETVAKEIEQNVEGAKSFVLSDISAAIQSSAIYVGAAVAIAIAMVIVMALVVTGMISRPIVELSKISDRISMGELEAEVPHQERDDEIGLLAKSIERLRRSLKIATDSLEEALR